VYNTGGWVVDTINPQPLHGGAIVVIDDQLNCASLRMYNEPKRGHTPAPVRVASCDQAGDNPLAVALARQLDASRRATDNPWTRFSATVGVAIQERASALRRRSR
jgi:hypothetical protein